VGPCKVSCIFFTSSEMGRGLDVAAGVGLGVCLGAGCLLALRSYERSLRYKVALDGVAGGTVRDVEGYSDVPPVVGSEENELLEEQLSRSAKFLGAEGQKKMENSFVIVVGVGGVGSHCTHFLARMGVRRLRVIDFDNVTLSSLNRHAVAGREDVGTPKVAALKRHINRFAPFCAVDARNVMFTEETSNMLLSGNPDYVVDCIDDMNTKIDLLKYCVKHDIRVISSMAAGARSDPTRLHFGSLSDVVRDPLASKLRWQLRRNSKPEDVPKYEKLEVLYSSEQTLIKLLPLDAEVAGEDPSSLGTVANFRVRVMPVLGTEPALFGIALAARVLTNLAETPFDCVSAPTLKAKSAPKYLQKVQKIVKDFNKRAESLENTKEQHLKSMDFLCDEDIYAIVAQYRQRCPVTTERMGASKRFGPVFWRYDRPCRADNLVFASEKVVIALNDLIERQQLPTPQNLGMDIDMFAHILDCQRALLSPELLLLKEKYTPDFERAVVRAIAHMNKDHADDCQTLVRAYGGVPTAVNATLTGIDRIGMFYDIHGDNGDVQKCRVLWPSYLIEPSELRETVVKLTIQARAALLAQTEE